MINKICILIPCHICYDKQLELLSKTLYSLINQSHKTDIYLSISFDNERYLEMFNNTIKPEFHNIIHIMISDTQLYQMEHLDNIRKYVNYYDLIMFCDDDDTYESDRVKIITNIYNYCLSKKTDDKYLGGFIEIIDVERDDAPEYWSYAITPHIFNDFYNRLKDDMDLLRYDYGDMYFRNYLRLVNTNITFCSCKFEKPYYNHFKNPNSICSRKTQCNYRYIRNVIILLTICMYNTKFIQEKCQISEEDIIKYVPELERIRKIKDKLYDNIQKSCV
jgi:hypothetical protein